MGCARTSKQLFLISLEIIVFAMHTSVDTSGWGTPKSTVIEVCHTKPHSVTLSSEINLMCCFNQLLQRQLCILTSARARHVSTPIVLLCSRPPNTCIMERAKALISEFRQQQQASMLDGNISQRSRSSVALEFKALFCFLHWVLSWFRFLDLLNCIIEWSFTITLKKKHCMHVH